MKRLFTATALMFLTLSNTSNAQVKEKKQVTNKCSRLYLGLNSGINNHNGLLGVSIEVPVAPKFSVGTGIGLSSWGWKFFGEGRYYIADNCHRKTAIGIGITRNTGETGVPLKAAQTNYGKIDIVFDAKPATNGFVSLYHFWTVGRKRVNKFYTQVGYSFAIQRAEYSLDQSTLIKYPGIKLTTDTDKAIRNSSPGGVILGFGWYFNLDN